MSNLAERIRIAQRDTAERAVIDSIPRDIMENMKRAQAAHEAKGGCPGCGSMVLAVHHIPCSECAKHPFD
jgi:hypothetical protein